MIKKSNTLKAQSSTIVTPSLLEIKSIDVYKATILKTGRVSSCMYYQYLEMTMNSRPDWEAWMLI